MIPQAVDIFTLQCLGLGTHQRKFLQFNQILNMNGMNPKVAHPMEKLQRQVQKLVDSKLLKPNDSLWKIALLYGDEWAYWKSELADFDFSMQDPVSELLAVESWEEE